MTQTNQQKAAEKLGMHYIACKGNCGRGFRVPKTTVEVVCYFCYYNGVRLSEGHKVGIKV